MLSLISQASNSNFQEVFGTVAAPARVEAYNKDAGGIGLLLFVSRGIQLITIVAGILLLFNIVLAGVGIMSSAGKSEGYKKAADKITMSVVGLFLIVMSYAIIGLVGLVLFGDATYILNPKISSPTQIQTTTPSQTP